MLQGDVRVADLSPIKTLYPVETLRVVPNYINKRGVSRFSLQWSSKPQCLVNDLHGIQRQVCTWEAADGGTSPSIQECLAKVSGILQWLFGVWFTEVIGELVDIVY